MVETFSNDFKKIFLLSFTKELIRHSERRDILKLKQIIELKEEQEKIPSIISSEPIAPEEIIELKKKITLPPKKIFPPTRTGLPVRRIIRQPLMIPEAKLPAHLEYLKPIPVPGVEIDLSKINPLIKDPAVRVIEGNQDENVIVSGAMGTKPTSIILNKEDIDRIINKFSEVSKIPVTSGIYRVVVGNLILSAIISEVISSRFVIRKMLVPPKQYSPQNIKPRFKR
ncbi:Uncharacterised protein [uncultured archaeon]|nr:Uncharacterised protein [uncultured archaeon]